MYNSRVFSWFRVVKGLFLFNGCRWFGVDIIYNVINFFNVVDNFIGYFG